MRRAVTPAIPPSLYRHFAIVTVTITALLALFADGERSEVEPAPVLQVAPSSPSSPSDDWDAEGFIGEFGSPMDALAGGESSVVPELSEMAPPEFVPGQAAALAEGERRLLLQGLRDKGLPAPDGRIP